MFQTNQNHDSYLPVVCKNYLILGGAGMLGMHLIPYLIQRGNIYIIDNFSRSKPRKQEFKALYDAMCSTFTNRVFGLSTANLTRLNQEQIDALTALNIDCVINCAADVGGVFYNREASHQIFVNNAALQTAGVDIAERIGARMLVQISSVCVYTPQKGPEAEPLKECVPWELGPLSNDNVGYAMAKRSGEMLAWKSKVPDVYILRPTNMAGKYDYFDKKAHVIPALVRRSLLPYESVLTVNGYANTVREFMSPDVAARYITELVGIVGIGRKIFNLSGGPGNAISLHDLANHKILRGNKPTNFVGRPPLPGEDIYRTVDGTAVNDFLSSRIPGRIVEDKIDMIIYDVVQYCNYLYTNASHHLEEDF